MKAKVTAGRYVTSNSKHNDMQTKTKGEKKQEAIAEWVEREFNAISREWVEVVMDKFGFAEPLPMWGTLWTVNEYIGGMLWRNSRVMLGTLEELRADIKGNPAGYSAYERDRLKKAIQAEDWAVLQEYINESMAGGRCVLDKDGDTTAVFIYDLADEYVIGVNGAGWNFYHGVWDKLYDLCRMRWHEHAPTPALTPQTRECVRGLLEHYLESSSGKEPGNKEAAEKALAELYRPNYELTQFMIQG